MTLFWREQRAQYANLAQHIRKSAASLGPITRKLTHLVQPSDDYLLLVFHIGSDEVAKRRPRSMKRDFRALGRLVKGSDAHVFFPLTFQYQETILKWAGRSSWSIYCWKASVTGRILDFLVVGWSIQHQACWHLMVYTFLWGKKDFCARVSRVDW